MENKEKETYEAPELQVVEVQVEGVICTSGDRNGYPGYELE